MRKKKRIDVPMAQTTRLASFGPASVTAALLILQEIHRI